MKDAFLVIALWLGAAITFFVIAFMLWLYVPSLFAGCSRCETPIETYERVYAECLTRETISAAQCHDIALIEAYDE